MIQYILVTDLEEEKSNTQESRNVGGNLSLEEVVEQNNEPLTPDILLMRRWEIFEKSLGGKLQLGSISVLLLLILDKGGS